MTGQHDGPTPDATAAGLDIDAPDMPAPQVTEVTAHSIPGGLGLLLTVVGVLAGVGLAIVGGVIGSGGNNAVGVPLLIVGILLVITSFFCMSGVKMVAPGEARVIQLFGRYVGTIRADGLRWINPLTSSRKISTRVRNHETAVLKVNDAYG
ncbi:SPFH domain-containing protein, partial [Streptomyces sp. SID8455]|nr:SPFH domain-containing protein [Streptomyces sp. SID8455]